MANFFTDNDDLRYYFEHGIDWDRLLSATEVAADEDRPATTAEAIELYREIADLVGKFVAEEIAPHADEIDRESVTLADGEAVLPARFHEIFERIHALDLHRLCLPRSLGGMNCPLLLYFINTELFSRADVSVMAHHGFHGGMALAMLHFSLREGTTEVVDGKLISTRFADEIAEILRGEAWGTMDITEPDAGSDMAALRTKAEQDSEGRWFLTGQKVFITSGHGKYHFVIARSEPRPAEREGDDPMAGLGGLSLFLVRAYEDDEQGRRRRFITLDRVEEKLGHHGSCTAALSFDRTPAQLIGKRGEGFRHMLTLMNNARLAVGFECIGLCEAAYRLARSYAAERRSMGKTIDRHEMIADYLDEMRTDIQGLRALAMSGAQSEELAQKLEHQLLSGLPRDALARQRTERQQKRHKARARRVTPLLKYLAAEKAVEMARRCVQIHGGNGYMREFGAEKLLRDATVMPIYEGTSQIQSLMVIKDTLGGAIKAPHEFVRRLAQARWRSLSARDPLERRVARLKVLALDAQQYLLRRTATDKFRALGDRPLSEWPQALLSQWDPKRDFAHALLHAERFTRLLADVAVCETLLRQARRDRERAEVLSRYLERAEPRCRYLVDRITSTGDALLDRLHGDTSDEAAHRA